MSLDVSLKVIEPVFESQTKTKLGSVNMDHKGPSIKLFIQDFLSKELDNYWQLALPFY